MIKFKQSKVEEEKQNGGTEGQTMDELKPCPLCGGKAKATYGTRGPGEVALYIHCESCWLEKHEVVLFDNDDMSIERLKNGIKKLYEEWNRRVNDAIS